MPSAHSATVTALATTTAIGSGFGSVAFGISAVLAAIVMYDSAGVRQSVSEQAALLNRVVKEIGIKRSRVISN